MFYSCSMPDCTYHNMHSKIIILCYIPALLLLSCNNNREAIDNDMPPLYPFPIRAELNIEDGYSVNPLSGDSIDPVITSFGDTLITGRPVLGHPIVVNPAIVAKAETMYIGKKLEIPEDYMVTERKLNPRTIKVSKDNLKTFTPGKDSSSFILINSLGDTVPTGVAIPMKGRTEPCLQPRPIKALPPRMMKNATTNLRFLDEYNGMSTSNVKRIIEDSRGYLWIGNLGGGVSRYDGNSFTHFVLENGFNTNDVTAIIEDSKSNLWFGTKENGVIKYDGHSYTQYTEIEGLSNNHILSIIEDRDGHIWFSSWGGGVSRFDGQSITHFTEKEGLSSNIVYSMMEDHTGNLWFGTIFGGVCMYDGKCFTQFRENDGLGNDLVFFIYEDSKDNIWFAHNAGVTKYDGDSLTRYYKKEAIGLWEIRAIAEDNSGNIWFSSEMGGGVNKFNGHTFTNYSDRQGLSNSCVWAILIDSKQNLWFSTWGGGVNVYQDESFQHFIYKNYLNDDAVRSILEDNNQTIWLAGNQYYNGKRFEIFSRSPMTNWLFLQDSHGNRWYSAGNDAHRYIDGGDEIGGLSMVYEDTITYFSENTGLRYPHIKSMIEDSKGNIWIHFMQNMGISMFDGVTFTHFTEKEGLSSNKVNSIMGDRDGNVWFCYEGYGISKYNGTHFTHYTKKEGLNDNFVNTVMEDSEGRLWFGTMMGGVNIFDGHTFTYIGEREGLTNNEVRSILEDNEKRIWIATRKGLNCLLVNPVNTSMQVSFKEPQIYTFDKLDGLNEIDFNIQAALADSKNRLWWHTERCLTMLCTDHFYLPDAPPEFLHLNHIEINGAYLDFRNLPDSLSSKVTFDSVARFQNYPLNMKLPYRHNHLTFNYSAIDWAAPHKIRYSYMMEGLDKSWSNPSSEHIAEYRNLPSGTHTFIVRAIGAAQTWSDPFSYTFTIRPPWWQAWWAYIIYALIILSIIDQYRRYVLRRARLKSAIEIERIEKNKVVEMDQMKSRFFANISHEFRTPLTLILGPIEGMLRNRSDKVFIERNDLGVIRRNAKRLQQLINQILDISRLETGKMKMQVSEGNLEEFMRIIILSFLSLAESKKITYSFDLPGTNQAVYYDADKVEKILGNLLSNAFKFTTSEGEVKVIYRIISSSRDDPGSQAQIIVRDTGTGISPEKLERIFDRYYQGNDSDTRDVEGSGIGLALTKELVDLYRGEISVESEVGKGSTFKVLLPVSREIFTEEEISPVGPVVDSSEKGKVKKMVREEIREHVNEATKIEGNIQEEEIYVEQNGQTGQAEDHPMILIVEDNSDLRDYISRNLGYSYEIRTAENGKEGLADAIEHIPDLVISDVMMPVMDGVEMCRQLKTDERTNHIPVIMLTAKADQSSKIEGLETGSDDYIIKPFDTEELQVRVRNLIEQRKNLREKFRKEFASGTTIKEEMLPQDQVLSRVTEYFNRHIDDPDFKMEDLAAELHMSRSQIFRKVSAVSGSTPQELLRIIRMKKAAFLLQYGDDNVSQIMYQVGYRSTSHFARAFKQAFGLNPSEYKNHGKQ